MAPRKRQKLSNSKGTKKTPTRNSKGRFARLPFDFPKFMQLPIEIRNMIYTLAFSGPKTLSAKNVKVHYKYVNTGDQEAISSGEHAGYNLLFNLFPNYEAVPHTSYHGHPQALRPNDVLGLFSVSKQVSAEAIPCFFMNRDFIFNKDKDLYAFLSSLTDERKAWLTKITLTTPPDHHKVTNLPKLFVLLKSCPRLSVVQLKLLDRFNPKDLLNVKNWKMSDMLKLAGKWNEAREWKKYSIVIRGNGKQKAIGEGGAGSEYKEIVLSEVDNEENADRVIEALRSMWLMYSTCGIGHDLSLI